MKEFYFNDELKDLMIKTANELEPFIKELREAGLLLPNDKTFRMFVGGCEIFFGGAEIEILRNKANNFDRIVKAFEELNESQ